MFLILRRCLNGPLLYLSAGIERQRDKHYAALSATRTDGSAVPWIEPFLAVVRDQSADAVAWTATDRRTARALGQLADAGVLEETALAACGQRRYVAGELMYVVTADDLGAGGVRQWRETTLGDVTENYQPKRTPYTGARGTER
jgi:hypothetical protein